MSKTAHYVLNQITLIICAAATGLIIFLMAKRIVPYGIEDEWVWPPALDANWSILEVVFLILVAFAAVVGVISSKIGKLTGKREVAIIVLSIVLALTLQFTVGYVSGAGPGESVYAIYNPWCSGYWLKASKIEDLETFLTKYRIPIDASRRSGEYHAHFPGPTFLFWLTDQLCEHNPRFASACLRFVESLPEVSPETFDVLKDVTETQQASLWLSTFVARFIACLAVVPLYLFTRRLYSKETAFFALALYSVIPSVLLFSPGVDQMFPLMALTLCYCHHRAVSENSCGWACATGLAAFLALYCSLALLVVIFLNLIITGLGTIQPSDATTGGARWKSIVKLAAVSCISFVSITLILLVAFRHNVIKIWFQAYQRNKMFNEVQARTYWKWALFNPVELLVFMGIPAAVLFVRGTIGELARAMKTSFFTYLRQADAFLICFILTLFLLDISGQNRGEIARLWIYLMPFACIIAAKELSHFGERRHVSFAFLTGLQFLQVVVFKCILDVLGLY